MKRLFVLLTIMSTVLMSPRYIFAESSGFSIGMLEGANNVYKVNDGTVVVNHDNKLDFIDIIQGKIAKAINLNQKILDVDVMTNPNKIIALTLTSSNKIQKHVFNANGAEISKYDYALSVPKNGKVKWAPPYNGINERLMIQDGNLFSLYQTTAKKPLVVYKAKYDNTIYENIDIDDWDFRSYPYLVIKYTGQRIMSIDSLVQIVNLYSKKVTNISDLTTDVDLAINEHNQLEMTSSFQYSDIVPPNSTHPEPTDEQSFDALYSLNSGKEILANKAMFNQVYGQISGWNTQIVGGYVFVEDLENNMWSLYQSGGTSVAEKKTGLGSKPKFLLYNDLNHTAYFLVAEQQSSSPVIKTILVK